MARAVDAARARIRRRPLAPADPCPAGRVPARAWDRAWQHGPRPSAQIWPRESGVLHRIAHSRGRRGGTARSTSMPAWPTPSPGRNRRSPAGPVRTPGQGAGRRGRRHHPLERTVESDQLQDRPRPHRRMHGDPEVITRGAGRGLSGRRGGRGDRPSARGDQRGHRRPRGVGAAGTGSRGSTRSPSPAPPRPDVGSPHCAASGSPVAPSSSGESRPPSSSMTSISG